MSLNEVETLPRNPMTPIKVSAVATRSTLVWAVLVAAGLLAGIAAAQPTDLPASRQPSREQLAQLFETVPPKITEHRGLRVDDDPAYFGTFAYVRNADLESLRAEAAQNEAYREAEHDKRLPHLRYSLFADLLNNPDWWQGKAVRLIGHANRVVTYDPGKNDIGISSVYESWVVSDSSLQYPATVVTLDVPPGTAIGESDAVGVDVTGIFFQLFTYKARDGLTHYAPLILASRWDPPAPKQASKEAWWLAGLAILFGISTSTTLLKAAGRKRRRTALAAPDTLSLEAIDGPDSQDDAAASPD